MTYPLETKERAINLYLSGSSTYQVSEEFGMTPQTVGVWCRQAGVIRKVKPMIQTALDGFFPDYLNEEAKSFIAFIIWCFTSSLCNWSVRY